MLRLWLLTLWAHGGLAQLNGPVIPLMYDAAAIQAAGDIDDCATVLSVYESCYSQPSFTAQPRSSQAACLCCDGTTNMSPVFGSCATYASTALPQETIFLENNKILSSFCSSAGNGPCTAGGAPIPTPAPTSSGGSSRPTTTPPTTELSYPPACSSLDDLIFSCQRETSTFLSLSASSQVSCICYNSRDVFTTAFDRYASGCLSFIRTADPTEYSRIAPWTTFCARRSPDPTSGNDDSSSVPTSLSSTRPRSTLTITDPNFTGTIQVPTGRPTTSVSTQGPGIQVTASGPVAWVAQALTLILSFFFLV